VNNIKKQQLTNSVLNQVRRGEKEVQLFNFHYNAESIKEEELQFLRESLLDYGQIDPIYVVIEDLFGSDPIVRVVSGYKRILVINQLRAEGKWNKGLYVKLYKDTESDTKGPAGFFANSNFVRTNYSTMQKGIFAGVMLCPGLRAKGKANQAGHEQVTVRVNTVIDAGRKVGVNEKAVKLGERLAALDTWFYTYIWEEQNDMTTSDVKALLSKKSNPDVQRAIVDKMIELHAENKAIELKNKFKPKAKPKQIQKSPLDDLFTPEEKIEDELLTGTWEEPKRTLYHRALSKVSSAIMVAKPETAENKVKSIFGHELPSREQLALDIAEQQAFGQDIPVKYVEKHGTGDKRIDVHFNLPEDLAETIRYACEVRGIYVTINSIPSVDLKVAA
jgi:hypothetical protein